MQDNRIESLSKLKETYKDNIPCLMVKGEANDLLEGISIKFVGKQSLEDMKSIIASLKDDVLESFVKLYYKNYQGNLYSVYKSDELVGLVFVTSGMLYSGDAQFNGLSLIACEKTEGDALVLAKAVGLYLNQLKYFYEKHGLPICIHVKDTREDIFFYKYLMRQFVDMHDVVYLGCKSTEDAQDAKEVSREIAKLVEYAVRGDNMYFARGSLVPLGYNEETRFLDLMQSAVGIDGLIESLIAYRKSKFGDASKFSNKE